MTKRSLAWFAALAVTVCCLLCMTACGAPAAADGTEGGEEHTHEYTDTVVKATCTTDGYTLHTCAVCGHSYKNKLTPAKGHDYGEDGYCTRCEKFNKWYSALEETTYRYTHIHRDSLTDVASQKTNYARVWNGEYAKLDYPDLGENGIVQYELISDGKLYDLVYDSIGEYFFRTDGYFDGIDYDLNEYFMVKRKLSMNIFLKAGYFDDYDFDTWQETGNTDKIVDGEVASGTYTIFTFDAQNRLVKFEEAYTSAAISFYEEYTISYDVEEFSLPDYYIPGGSEIDND